MIRPSHMIFGLSGALFSAAWSGHDAGLWWFAAGAGVLAMWSALSESR